MKSLLTMYFSTLSQKDRISLQQTFFKHRLRFDDPYYRAEGGEGLWPTAHIAYDYFYSNTCRMKNGSNIRTIQRATRDRLRSFQASVTLFRLFVSSRGTFRPNFFFSVSQKAYLFVYSNYVRNDFRYFYLIIFLDSS